MAVSSRYDEASADVDIPGWERLQPHEDARTNQLFNWRMVRSWTLDMECMQPLGVSPADW